MSLSVTQLLYHLVCRPLRVGLFHDGQISFCPRKSRVSEITLNVPRWNALQHLVGAVRFSKVMEDVSARFGSAEGVRPLCVLRTLLQRVDAVGEVLVRRAQVCRKK